MFGLSKLWGYVAVAGGVLMAVIGVFLKGRSSGIQEAENDAREALDEAESESAADGAELQRKVDEAAKEDFDDRRDIN